MVGWAVERGRRRRDDSGLLVGSALVEEAVLRLAGRALGVVEGLASAELAAGGTPWRLVEEDADELEEDDERGGSGCCGDVVRHVTRSAASAAGKSALASAAVIGVNPSAEGVESGGAARQLSRAPCAEVIWVLVSSIVANCNAITIAWAARWLVK